MNSSNNNLVITNDTDNDSDNLNSSSDKTNTDNIPFIFKAMQPTEANELLLNEAKKLNIDSAWHIRASRQRGMLTIHKVFKDQITKQWETNIKRSCLTNNGWEDATYPVKSEAFLKIKEKMISIQDQIPLEESKKQVFNLLQLTNNQYGLQKSRMLWPSECQVTEDTAYCNYTVKKSKKKEQKYLPNGFFKLESKHSSEKEIDVIIENKELFNLVTDPYTRKIMINPVTRISNNLNQAISMDQVTAEQKQLRLGIDYFPNYKLTNICKYITVICSSKADSKLKTAKLEQLIDELQDPISFDFITDPIVLSTGHIVDRQSYSQLPKLKCPITNLPIEGTSVDNVTRSLVKLLIEDNVLEELKKIASQDPEESNEKLIIPKTSRKNFN